MRRRFAGKTSTNGRSFEPIASSIFRFNFLPTAAVAELMASPVISVGMVCSLDACKGSIRCSSGLSSWARSDGPRRGHGRVMLRHFESRKSFDLEASRRIPDSEFDRSAGGCSTSKPAEPHGITSSSLSTEFEDPRTRPSFALSLPFQQKYKQWSRLVPYHAIALQTSSSTCSRRYRPLAASTTILRRPSPPPRKIPSRCRRVSAARHPHQPLPDR